MVKDEGLLITVGIPVYNGANSIADLINSIVISNEIASKIEVIVSDNCSTDSTANVVERFSHVRYFKNDENIGYDRNVNNLFEKAQGKFVWIIGADDIILGELTLEKICKWIQDFEDLGLINVSENTNLKQDFEVYKNDEKFLIDSSFQSGFLSANIIKRDAWLNNQPSRFFGSGWIHFGVVINIVNKYTSIISKEKLVGENPKFSHELKSWDKNGSSVPIMLELVKIFKAMPNLGYSKGVSKKAKLLIKGQYPKNLIKARANGLSITKSLILDLISCYNRFPTFWLIDIPSLLLPRFIARKIYNLRKTS